MRLFSPCRAGVFACIFGIAATAQEPVAPTTEKVGPVRGENAGGYNVVQSWEFGYRFAEAGGNRGEYRSDVNFGNGIRLLGSSLTVNSKDGHGHFFDEIILTTQGLGNDPYESAVLRVQKNRIYNYNMTWRQNQYFNPGLVTANGFHAMDTIYRWQDHDLTLFPQSKYRLYLGYGRTTNSGPALTSEQLFTTRGDTFPLFSNVKQEFDSYRLGGEIEFAGFHVNVLRRWEYTKDDTTSFINAPTLGDNASDTTTVSSLARAEPYHGSSNGWMVNLSTHRRWFELEGRYNYTGGNRNFFFNETAVGLDRLIGADNRQLLISGNAQRPVTNANFSFSIFATSKLTVINHSSYSNVRMDGNNFFQQFDNATQGVTVLNFQLLGIRLFTNSTDVRYQFNRKFSAYTGYEYSNRLIHSIEDSATPGTTFSGIEAHQLNHVHAGIAGINWTPYQPLRIHVEGEIGRNDNPFAPISERNYHAINGRVDYRRKSLQLSSAYKQNYNNNSITLTAYSSHARNFSANAAWTGRPWFSIDAAYSHLHLDTLGGIAFFAGTTRSQLVTGQESLYISNIHSGTLTARFGVTKRVDLFVGYNVTRDAGDGRASNTGPTDPVAALLYSVQTFPLIYQSPLVRLSVKLHEKVRFNVGYQYYGYKEDFGLFGINDNYRANTGYTSLLWSF